MATTVWRGFISFGLISIPVRLFRAARAERVNLRRLYRQQERFDEADEQTVSMPAQATPPPSRPVSAGAASQPIADPALQLPGRPALAPVQQVSVRKGSDEVLPQGSVVKGYEYEKDRYVAIEPEVLKSIAPKTATAMQIEEFVNLSQVDPVYFETSYYVVPEEAGRKAYALLYRALQTTGLVAVAQLAMHSREHVVIVRPAARGLVAHTMFYASEVRADEEYEADVKAVAPKELELAQTLIQSLAADFEPQKYRDNYREKLEGLIAKRVAGEPIETPEKPGRSAPVVDITEALQRSLAALKKPAASEAKPRKTAGESTAQTKRRSRG